MIMNDNKLIADLLLPDINTDTNYYERLYPERNLPNKAMVTRFAPSPTGFLHLGSLYASLICERLAHQSGGVFYIRIEDTDKKREVKGSIAEVVRGLMSYNINFDEGVTDGYNEKGSYGPYKQSSREHIYKCYVKMLLEKGIAYPCFCTEEDLHSLRKLQEFNKVNTGYYGCYAKHRNITYGEIKDKLSLGKSYVIRLKSPGDPEKRIVFDDLIKGTIEMPENIQDIVILKSDGLPTYHFAHVVDDHLMRTTHIIRGEEWLPSVPLHLQLFDILGFEKPKYAHISTLLKLEGNSKRKLSKRKDPELAFSYYDQQGYLPKAVIEYLLRIINSNFEDWRNSNLSKPYTDFIIDLGKMSTAGALFDVNKLMDISREIIASMNASEVYFAYVKWAEAYDREMAELLNRNEKYGTAIFNIERSVNKPRKDISKWTDVHKDLYFFFDELFYTRDKEYCFPSSLSKENILDILNKYSSYYDENDNREEWFEHLKSFSQSLGYSENVKTYKKNPELYKGHVGDVAMVLRVALAKKTNTPDLYEVIKVMGRLRLEERLKAAFGLIGKGK